MARDYQYYFAQLQRIEEHREKQAEKEIRKLYKQILKETKQFIAEEYYQLAEDGKLTFEILRSKSMDARFLQQVEEKLDGISLDVSREIKKTVEEMYQLSYDGLKDAVTKGTDTAQFFDGMTTETAQEMWNTVDNTIMDIALEKNHKSIIWDIKREVATALTVGDRFDTMAKRIAEKLNGNYKKAILISRTEVGRVREAGHLASAKSINDDLKKGQSGMRMVKTWKSMKDGSVRDQHKSMHGKTIEMDDDFILPDGTKTQAPKQSGVARHDCNCRCYVSYHMMDDDEFFAKTGDHFKGFTEEYREESKNTYDDTVVSPFVKTAEYRNLYNRIGESTDIQRIACERARNMLYHRSGTKFEDLTLINTVTGENLTRSDYDVELEVIPSKKMRSMVRNSDPYTIIAIHNHSGNGLPSMADLNSAYKNK